VRKLFNKGGFLLAVSMAKRFTDTEKWKDPWFDELSLQAKLFFFYFVDNCDHAGVFNVSLKKFNRDTGCRYKESDLKRDYAGKLRFLVNGRIWMPKFIDFQYGKLSETNNAHKGVFKSLEYNNIQIRGFDGASMGHYSGAQDKATEKDKEKEKEKITADLVFESWKSLGENLNAYFLTPVQVQKLKSLGDAGIDPEQYKKAIKKLGRSKWFQSRENKRISLILSPEVIGLALQDDDPIEMDSFLSGLGLDVED
jgi:hypothetical protein